MRVFATDFLTAGGFRHLPQSASLLREGRAMVTAVLSDLGRIANVRTVTLWDESMPSPGIAGVETVRVGTPEERKRQFDRLAAQADAVLVIAPEIDGNLARQLERVEFVGGRILGPSVEAVELTSDKLQLPAFLEECGIPTIPTRKYLPAELLSASTGPVVVKPRFGAGSIDVQIFEPPFAAMSIPPAAAVATTDRVVQPLIAGESLSVGVLASRRRSLIEIFPLADQILSDDGRLQYLGGRVPSRWNKNEIVVNAVRKIIEDLCRAVPGLDGYFGVDLILPDGEPAAPLLVEVNPRLTTSYLGYRQLTRCNLAERLLFSETQEQPIRWAAGPVNFHPDGRIL
ncbi:MAG: ATP-grasp domain-containing protein [Planctomycetes bacterium]|nr:ATP-grasp domain-containing protein [Planctomycetota bacterium]